MDFNNLQSAWDNDTNNDIQLPNQLDKLQSAKTPLDKIRKNLRHEFIYQLIAIVFIAFLPGRYQLHPAFNTSFYLVYLIFAAISAYYLIKLYFFYKRLDDKASNTKDNLYETYYDICLNIELYKTFTYSLTPFALVLMALFILGDSRMKLYETIQLDKISETSMVIGIVLFAFLMLIIGLMAEAWVYFCYGKYAREIKKVLEELKEE